MDKDNFVAIMTAIINYNKEGRLVGKFFEEHICKGSFCSISFGSELENVVIKFLSNYFGCDDKYGGLINWWLFENVEKKIWEKKKKYDVSTLDKFYDYLETNRKKG